MREKLDGLGVWLSWRNVRSGISPKFIFANCVGNSYQKGLELYFCKQYWLLRNVNIIPGKMRGKLNGLGMWLSWRDVASGLPDDFAWDTSITCTTGLKSYYYYKMSAVGSRISSKLIFASCVGYFDRAYYGFCVTPSRMLVLTEGDKI